MNCKQNQKINQVKESTCLCHHFWEKAVDFFEKLCII